MDLKQYMIELEDEYAKQQKQLNYDEWMLFSVKINRPLREYMDEIKNDKSKKKEYLAATYAFQLWNEFTTKLRGDPLTDRFVTRVAELRFQIKKMIF
ncbi:hypothetical protein [Paenibacillus sp. RU26A]|nr:hypothetical protein [Paenibacillus sp. RU26A]SLJ98210.1 hypothetical protein SAMN06272722_102713 [Paenibacillus sp. RU5A]SOC66802.1 hypothetical protein SAMN05880581_102284 [Paenibacillus sp. RU26A]SOC70049.1 hypothetical protein SAMN05880586_102713 [Paenibacillus sp. RU5M]